MQNTLNLLRQKMQEAGIHACLIPSTDPHQSEYLAEHWQVRKYISGFTGSAGELLVTLHQAALWTDSRYFLQAEQQLQNSGIQLMKAGLPETPSITQWITTHLKTGETIGINGWQFSHKRCKTIKKSIEKSGIHIITTFDPYTEIWPQRPPLPKDPIFDFPEKFAGESRENKLRRLQEKIKQQNTDYLLVTALDEIAWLFNLRGNDVHCNPVFYAYALIGQKNAFLFLPSGKCPPKLQKHLAKANIHLLEYKKITHFINNNISKNDRLWVPETQTNEALYQAAKQNITTKKESPLLLMKAIKNKVEINFTRQAMIMDGLALFHFYRWLEKTLKTRPLSEVEVAEKLNEFRSTQTNFFGPSFDTIVGFKKNGAIVHYKPEAENCAMIQPPGMLLIDSGGQYMEGTTDITRTTYLGEPGKEEKQHFTLVLKGHIALATARFPKGTTGCQLDILARHALWKEKLNYGHGTGHGVGFFLNVHEGPQRIAPSRSQVPIQAGMISSNEPGYYRNGHYGIRIENLILCKETTNNFLEFETLTLFPIQKKLIDTSLLTPAETQWLNDYHQKVYEQLSPFLRNEDIKHLRLQTSPI